MRKITINLNNIDHSDILKKSAMKYIMGGTYPNCIIVCDWGSYSGLCAFDTCDECKTNPPPNCSVESCTNCIL